MNNAQLKNWILNNKAAITQRVNEHATACNIRISEFTGEQKKTLIIGLFAAEIKQMLK